MGWLHRTQSAPWAFEAMVLAAAESFGLGGRVVRLAFDELGERPGRARRAARDVAAEQLGPLIYQIDRGSSAERLPFPEESADVIVWHGWPQRDWDTGRWAEAIERRLRPGGLWLALATTHVGPDGLLRLPPSPVAIERGLGDAPAHVVAWQGSEPCPHTVYLVVFKSPATRLSLPTFDRFAERLRTHLDAGPPGGAWGRRLASRLRRWRPFGRAGRAADVRFAVHFASRSPAPAEPTAGETLLEVRNRASGRCR